MIVEFTQVCLIAIILKMTNDEPTSYSDYWHAGDIECDGTGISEINNSDIKCNQNNGYVHNGEVCVKRLYRGNPQATFQCALSDTTDVEVSACDDETTLGYLIKDDVFLGNALNIDASNIHSAIGKPVDEGELNTPELSDDEQDVKENGDFQKPGTFQYTPLGFSSGGFDGLSCCSKCGSSDSKQFNKVNERPQSNFCYWRVILEPDKDEDNLLFMAILLGWSNLCNALLALIPKQCLIQIRHNKLFQTALHLAALTENTKLTRRVLVAGVQLDCQDHNGNTALHIACKRRNIEIAKALLEPVTPFEAEQNTYHITDPPRVPQHLEIRNYAGETCFMIAAINGDISMMDLLVSEGADINVKDIKSGMNCLHLLTELGRIDIVKYILDKKTVDINATTYALFTPLDIANLRGHSKIAYLLLCAGAKPKLRPKDSKDFLAESDSDESDD